MLLFLQFLQSRLRTIHTFHSRESYDVIACYNKNVFSAYKAEKRTGRNRREGREGRDVRETREGREGRRGEAESAGVALAPPLDAHHARRYNDMAPKHWEEGLPRYHGPTEYERPPPYYYPGPK
ncbi:unnamed protein product [Pieris macdunnoughi]|uniref:Uncharacterized protein n=1 Tax=Pieris macdunnoughi TaxID=345717 RepID=A0A821QEQ5_9NEOP|nr:unnamed protein product [Pieris macdunnoughi]